MKTMETERLILRSWRPDDLKDLHAYASSPLVGPMAGWRPCANLQESRAMLKGLMESSAAWAIALKESGKVIGHVKLRADENRGRYYAIAVSYALSEAHWGRGYAAEAVEAVVHYAFEEMKVDLISAFHFPENIRSKRVLEKCGFEYEGTLIGTARRHDGSMTDAVCYSLLRD